jgi:hypothetical protein
MNGYIPRALARTAAVFAFLSLGGAVYLEGWQQPWLAAHPISVNLISAFICFNFALIFLSKVLKWLTETEQIRDGHAQFLRRLNDVTGAHYREPAALLHNIFWWDQETYGRRRDFDLAVPYRDHFFSGPGTIRYVSRREYRMIKKCMALGYGTDPEQTLAIADSYQTRAVELLNALTRLADDYDLRAGTRFGDCLPPARRERRYQVVSASPADIRNEFKRSAGVSHPNVILGRPLSISAISSSWTCV